MHPGWTSPEHVITTLHPASMYNYSVNDVRVLQVSFPPSSYVLPKSGKSRSYVHETMYAFDPMYTRLYAFVRLCMYLKLTFQSTDYAQKWVVCRVTGSDLVVLCNYLGPCVSAVITNGAPGLRHENPGVLPRFSSSAAVNVEAEAPRDPLCSCVISTYALPSVRTPYQKQLAWRVAKDSYQDCRDFLHGIRIELFFLEWKGTCNSSISYYTILTQWKKITTPQKLQTCGYVCVCWGS